MAQRYRYTVHCDARAAGVDPLGGAHATGAAHRSCPAYDEPGGDSPENATANAAANGWAHRDGLDLCPFHALWHTPAPRPAQRCRQCGCTDNDACLIDGVGPCSWVEHDQCNACRDFPGEASRRGLTTRA